MMRQTAMTLGLAAAVLLSATTPAGAVPRTDGLPPTYGISMTSDDYADEIGYHGESGFVVLVENTGNMTDVVTMDINHDALPPGVSKWDWYAIYCTTDGTWATFAAVLPRASRPRATVTRPFSCARRTGRSSRCRRFC